MKKNLVETAVENGLRGCSCSEALLTAFGPGFGLSPELALKTASGLAGGMGITRGTCGVVTAAIVILGLMAGPEGIGDGYGRQRVRMVCGEFTERFEALHGSLECRKLSRGMDLMTAEGARAIRESGIPEMLVRSAGELIEGLIVAGFG